MNKKIELVNTSSFFNAFYDTFLLLLLVFGLFFFEKVQAQELIPELPNTPFNYASPNLPTHFSQANVMAADTTPANNPTTDAGATLGRVLFYDKKLSANDTIACASCHKQSEGFSDSSRLSVGFAGGLTGRHSMGLANARYYEPNRFFWDERANGLEAQVLQPIQDPIEMGMNLNILVNKLSPYDYYQTLFTNAFGSPQVTSDRISRALAQFIRSMVSYQSRYDAGVASNFSNFTAQEEAGRQLFNSNKTRCNDCHETDLQLMDQARNNGLDATTTDEGAGNGRFKSPSLRNIAIRPPFMHDGRFSTLQEVVTFYNSGVQNHPNLDNRLQRNGQPVRMNLSAVEQAQLVAFMETLTDTSISTDNRFSDPFTGVLQEINGGLKAIPAIISLLLSD